MRPFGAMSRPWKNAYPSVPLTVVGELQCAPRSVDVATTIRPPAGVRVAQATATVVLPGRGSAPSEAKLSVRKLAPGIGSAMSTTGPTGAGRSTRPA